MVPKHRSEVGLTPKAIVTNRSHDYWYLDLGQIRDGAGPLPTTQIVGVGISKKQPSPTNHYSPTGVHPAQGLLVHRSVGMPYGPALRLRDRIDCVPYGQG